MAGYYDPNKDYSKELQRTDLTSAERSQLEQERQNKINDKYGGVEPNMYNSNKTYSQTVKESGGSSSGKSSGGSSELVKGPGYVTGGYQTGAYGTAILDDNPYWKGSSQADMSRRPDLAGKTAISNGYTVYYDENGYATKAVKGVTDYLPHQDFYVKTGQYSGGNLWTDEELLTASDLAQIAAIRNQMNAGQISGDQANQLANQIRSGYGYTIDKSGNVTDLGALSAVDARRQQWGMATNPISEEQQKYLQLMFPEQGTTDTDALLNSLYALNQGAYTPKNQNGVQSGGLGYIEGYDMGGYTSFEDFLNGMGYSDYTAATQAAIQAAVQQAINQYNQQIQDTTDDTEELARQAYIAKMLGQKNLDQKLAANGYAGGMADSQRIATETEYQNQLNDLEMQKEATIRELKNAIANAQLSGDLQTAQELSNYLLQVQGQWNSYVANQQALANQNYWNQVELDNQNYWNQQSLNAQNQEAAYTRALNLLNGGYLPDDDTLALAGISKTEAAALVQMVTGGGVTGTPQTGTTTTTPAAAPKRTGSPYNNGALTTEQVKQLQAYYGATPDGMWGADSKKAAGGLSADAAWAAYSGGLTGRTSLNWNQDEGNFTWNGRDYYNVNDLLRDLENTNLTTDEQAKLAKKFAQFGFDISFG